MYYIKKQIYIKELKRNASLYIGLPESYKKGKKRYPVLYMHDGHNLFDVNDAFIGVTWGVKEAFDKYKDLKEVIVVGISCAEGLSRLQEYNIFDMKHHSIKEFDVLKGNGRKYLKYLVEKLKPEIDKTYRTLKDADNTAIMGSSMGGVISNQAAGLYPDVFGRVGCLSNAFYVSYKSILEFNEKTDYSKIKKFYMDVGDSEGGRGSAKEYLRTNKAVYDILSKKIDKNALTFKIIKGGIHSERAWSKRLPAIIRILFK